MAERPPSSGGDENNPSPYSPSSADPEQSVALSQENMQIYARQLVFDFHNFARDCGKLSLLENQEENIQELDNLIYWFDKKITEIHERFNVFARFTSRAKAQRMPEVLYQQEQQTWQQGVQLLREEIEQKLEANGILCKLPPREILHMCTKEQGRGVRMQAKEDIKHAALPLQKDYLIVTQHKSDQEHIGFLEDALLAILEATKDPEDIYLVASVASRVYKQSGKDGYERSRQFMEEEIKPAVQKLALSPKETEQVLQMLRYLEFGREIIFNKIDTIQQEYQDILQDGRQDVLSAYLYKKGDWQNAAKALEQALPLLHRQYETYKKNGNFHNALETLLRISRFMTYRAITAFKTGQEQGKVSDFLRASSLLVEGTTQNEVDLIRPKGNDLFWKLFNPHITREQLLDFEEQYQAMVPIYEQNDAFEMLARTLLNLGIIAYKKSQLHVNGHGISAGNRPCHKTRAEHLQESQQFLVQAEKNIQERNLSHLDQVCLNYQSLVLFEWGECEKKNGKQEAGEQKIMQAQAVNTQAMAFPIPMREKENGGITAQQYVQEQYILTHLIHIYQQYAGKMDSPEMQENIYQQLLQLLKVLFHDDLYTCEHSERVGDLMVQHFYPYLKVIGESCVEENGTWSMRILDASALQSIFQSLPGRIWGENKEKDAVYQNTLITQYPSLLEQLRPHVEQYGPIWQSYRSLNPSMIRMIAIYHDIGKIGISLDVLNKPGDLASEEREEVNMHPIYGVHILDQLADVLQKFPVFEHIRRVCLQHHERFNGEGYPHKLQGMDIDIIAQMMLFCDVFDAKVHARVYRSKEYTPEQNRSHIQKELEKKSAPQYNPILAEIFMRQTVYS